METIETVHSRFYGKVKGSAVADASRYCVSPQGINDEWAVVPKMRAEYRDEPSSERRLGAPRLNETGATHGARDVVAERWC